ncbi:MAG: 50S ribosomal protein L22, partial [Bacteroidales bacterium]|nr:50S ribosomal protein L22 [Bacteroidales bacterium]
MGARKRISAGIRKEAAKERTQAVLRNVPTSP